MDEQTPQPHQPVDNGRLVENTDHHDTDRQAQLERLLRGLPPELQHMLDEEGPDKYEFFAMMKSFSGPLPDPHTLQQYKAIGTEVLESILETSRKEQAHRHEFQKRELELQAKALEIQELATREQYKKDSRGQWFGLTIGLTALGSGTFLAFTGHTVVATAIISTAIGALALAFVVGRVKSRKAGEKADTSEEH